MKVPTPSCPNTCSGTCRLDVHAARWCSLFGDLDLSHLPLLKEIGACRIEYIKCQNSHLVPRPLHSIRSYLPGFVTIISFPTAKNFSQSFCSVRITVIPPVDSHEAEGKQLAAWSPLGFSKSTGRNKAREGEGRGWLSSLLLVELSDGVGCS